MARILLLRPPSVFARAAYSAAVTPPLATAYLAASLRAEGHEVRVLDALGAAVDHIGPSYAPGICYRGLRDESIVERAQRAAPDGIGITATFSQDWPHIRRTIAALRRALPAVPIFVGGEHATAAPEHVLETSPGVDVVALGEGEGTVVDLAAWCDGRLALEDVPGIAHRDARGAVRRAPRRARLRDVDALPWPAWDLVDLDPYWRVGEGNGVERGRAIPILATRGCPYQCTFCSSPQMWTTRYVMRRPERVADEIEHWVGTYGIENVDFADLTAIIKRSWILAFCAEMRRRALGVSWQLPNGTRSEALDREVLHALRDAGCTNLSYAPETGSARTLAAIRKKASLAAMTESIREAKRNDLSVKCNFVIGFPRETRRDVLETIAFALRLAAMGVDDAGLYLFSPYPGTEDFEYLRSTGRIGALDDAYFASLTSTMDLSRSSAYCENIGPVELGAYRVGGMAAFYALGYLAHPSRLVRTVRNHRVGRSDTLFEQRLFGLVRRLRLEARARLHGPGAASDDGGAPWAGAASARADALSGSGHVAGARDAPSAG